MPDSHLRRGQSVRPGQPAGEGSSVLAHRIAVAAGDRPADLVLRGARVLSVFTGELLQADVAVAGEHVAGLGRPASWDFRPRSTGP